MLCITEFGVSYDTDIDLARRLILEEANKCSHRDEKVDEPWVRVIGHDDFAIRLRRYVWVPDVPCGLPGFGSWKALKSALTVRGWRYLFPTVPWFLKRIFLQLAGRRAIPRSQLEIAQKNKCLCPGAISIIIDCSINFNDESGN
jgi:hypothetical protein